MLIWITPMKHVDYCRVQMSECTRRRCSSSSVHTMKWQLKPIDCCPTLTWTSLRQCQTATGQTPVCSRCVASVILSFSARYLLWSFRLFGISCPLLRPPTCYDPLTCQIWSVFFICSRDSRGSQVQEVGYITRTVLVSAQLSYLDYELLSAISVSHSKCVALPILR